MNSKIQTRETKQEEYPATENLTREAFWNLYSPGCNEHLMLNQLRKSSSYVKELDLVAVSDTTIVGHIISTKARVKDEDGTMNEVLCVGPVSVLPEFQKNGIGSQLLKESIAISGKLNFTAMVLFGSPDYYSRFGFVNAEIYGISTKEGKNFPPFMALELKENSLSGIKGRFFEDEAYITDEVVLMKFDKKFPPRKKTKPRIDLSAYET